MASQVTSPTGTKRASFLDLPAEQRNEIYELAFTTPTSSTTAPLRLGKDQPPSKNILLACRQVHSDAKHMYKQAYRHFWTSNTFVIDQRDIFNETTDAELLAIKKEDLEHISELTIHRIAKPPHASRFTREFPHIYTLLPKQRIWASHFSGFDNRIMCMFADASTLPRIDGTGRLRLPFPCFVAGTLDELQRDEVEALGLWEQMVVLAIVPIFEFWHYVDQYGPLPRGLNCLWEVAKGQPEWLQRAYFRNEEGELEGRWERVLE